MVTSWGNLGFSSKREQQQNHLLDLRSEVFQFHQRYFKCLKWVIGWFSNNWSTQNESQMDWCALSERAWPFFQTNFEIGLSHIKTMSREKNEIRWLQPSPQPVLKPTSTLTKKHQGDLWTVTTLNRKKGHCIILSPSFHLTSDQDNDAAFVEEDAGSKKTSRKTASYLSS